jgi:stage V sporulation protein R
VRDDEEDDEMNVAAIHDERGYRKIKRALSKHYDIAYRDPDIQIVDVDLAGDRKLILSHRVLDGMILEENDTDRVLQHVADLWGYDVKLLEQDDSGTVKAEHTASPRRPFM